MAVLAIIGFVAADPLVLFGQEASGTRPLLVLGRDKLQSVLPSDTHLLVEAGAIERFLEQLDGTPPDWATVYGQGHHDPGHDDRLFSLNRERDAGREGKTALRWKVTFLWSGELSRYDQKASGFSVAVGPKFYRTRWGFVRFKPENLPGNLMAIPNPRLRESLRRKLEQGERIEIEVAMTGRLIPEESLVYDFSHEEEGRGLVMPVVQIERVEYLMLR
ncbi:MAG: hypothetical protein EPO64_00800 [Nitrospirae bacterium]|nr:MAG: hypothetical protein EPO64_00800 [Nitrospirota bacterium]